MKKSRKPQETPGQLNLFTEEDFGTATPAAAEEPARPARTAVNIDHTALFARLAASDFRRKFHLKPADIAYIQDKGMETLRQHAAEFVARRLAPAVIPNDGKQTPMRGHPVFIAQHATACCCRGCFAKWHHIPAGRALTEQEQAYAVSVLMAWIDREYACGGRH